MPPEADRRSASGILFQRPAEGSGPYGRFGGNQPIPLRQGTRALPYRIFYWYTLRRAGPMCSAENCRFRQFCSFLREEPRNFVQFILKTSCIFPRAMV